MCIVDAVEDHLGIVQNLLWDVYGRQKKVGKKESSGWFGEEQVWETRGKRGKKPTINWHFVSALVWPCSPSHLLTEFHFQLFLWLGSSLLCGPVCIQRAKCSNQSQTVDIRAHTPGCQQLERLESVHLFECVCQCVITTEHPARLTSKQGMMLRRQVLVWL